jgi:hypothetical protein
MSETVGDDLVARLAGWGIDGIVHGVRSRVTRKVFETSSLRRATSCRR